MLPSIAGNRSPNNGYVPGWQASHRKFTTVIARAFMQPSKVGALGVTIKSLPRIRYNKGALESVEHCGAIRHLISPFPSSFYISPNRR
jgi:hypothetical protein